MDSQQKRPIRVVFLSDALSQKLCNYSAITAEWPFSLVPGHEQADKLAKQCAQTEQPGANVSYQENDIISKTLIMPSQEKDA